MMVTMFVYIVIRITKLLFGSLAAVLFLRYGLVIVSLLH